MKRVNNILLWLVAFATLFYLILIEYFNGPALDDMLHMRWMDYWGGGMVDYLWGFYTSNSSRYVGYFVSGLIFKSWQCIGTSFPMSLVLLVLNIYLLMRTLQLIFCTPVKESLVYAIVLHGMFYLTMFDQSSYFWLITKYLYVLSHSVVLYGMAKLIRQQTGKWYDYVIIVIIAIGAGCSYEIYAPCLLVIMGCILLYLWKNNNLSLKRLFTQYPLLITAFVVITLAFASMAFAPGTGGRMNTCERFGIFSVEFVKCVVWDVYHMLKVEVYRLPYILLIIPILVSLVLRLPSVGNTISRTELIVNICKYTAIFIGIFMFSGMLNAWATGFITAARARNHLLIFMFIWMIFVIRDYFRWRQIRSVNQWVLCITLVLILAEWVYMIPTNYKEARDYRVSLDNRLEYIEELKMAGVSDTIIAVEPLDVAILHCSVDDVSQKFFPESRYTTHILLKPNEISPTTSIAESLCAQFNEAYRIVYKLDFDVVSTIDTHTERYSHD